MSISTIGRWGRSLAVRLPADIADDLSLAEGEVVQVERREEEIVIRKAARPLALVDLFRGKTPEEWREIYRDHVVDWGPDRGREIVEE